MQSSAEPISCSKPPGLSNRRWYLALIAIFLALCAIAISSESFWIDELGTEHFAGQPSLKAMWQEMLRLKWPELQAPLYTHYIWAWEHLFGNREWVLRCAGVPWYVLGAAVFAASFRTIQERITAAFLVALHPFVWFYLNEARLYSMELGFAFVLFGAMVQLFRLQDETGSGQDSRWLALACLSALALSLISALGMLWTLAAVIVVPAIFSKQVLLRWARKHWLLVGGTMLAFVPCGVYYLWTRWLGTEPSTVVARTDWRTLLFIGYELVGFNGVGPGRLALRETGIAAMKPWLGFLIAYGAAIAVVGFAGFQELRRQNRLRTVLMITLALSVPLAILLSLGLLTRFRLLGRHCTPLLVVIVYLMTLGAWALWKSGQLRQRAWVILFLGISLFACLSQRFDPRHARDDYRTAAQFAKECLSQNESVWWNADTFACTYYGVAATREEGPVPGKAWLLYAPPVGFGRDASPPDWVISSKPDCYDWRGGLREFLAAQRYVPVREFTAFKVFHRPVKVSQGDTSSVPGVP